MLAAGAACGVDSAFCASTPLQISSRRTPAIKRYGISRVPGNLKTHRFYRARPPATQAEHERYSCKSQKHTKGLTLCYDSGLSVLAFPGTPMSDRSARLHALQQALKERILILDGGMGTMIQSYRLEEEDYRGKRFQDFSHSLKGNNDLLCLTQPHIIAEIHRAYLDAGAHVISTNTFNSTSVSQADYGMQALVGELNLEAARLARK